MFWQCNAEGDLLRGYGPVTAHMLTASCGGARRRISWRAGEWNGEDSEGGRVGACTEGEEVICALMVGAQ